MGHKIATWFFELICILALVTTAIFLIVHWGAMPSRIPSHFSPTGEADKWGGKHILLLLMLSDFAIYLVLSVVARHQKFINLPIKVDRESPVVRQRLKEMVTLLKVVATLSFGLIIWNITRTALGYAQGIGHAFVPLLLISNLAIVLVYLVSVRKNHLNVND